jgi:Protein-disulfide isomerase
MSKPQPKKSSGGLPVVVIVLVAIVAAIVGLYYWNGSRADNRTAAGTPTPKPTAAGTPNFAAAPPGAQPPNFLGSPNAAVTVEEFADFQCPSCGATHPVMHQIQGIFGSRIKLIFRNFPLPMHDKAYDAAVAAEAAGMQGKFWDMHNLLYTNQQTWSADPNYKAVFKSYAEKIGLDVDKWENDMAGMGPKSRISADIERGKFLNINSTPTIYINGRSVPYPDMNVPTMQSLIEAALKENQPGQPQPAQPQAANPGAASGNPSSAGKSDNAPPKK